MTDVWDRRLRRAAELARQWPFAEEILGFYRELLQVQQRIFGESPDHPPAGEAFNGWFLAKLSELSGCVSRHGPPALAEEARSWEGSVGDRWWKEHGQHPPVGPCEACPSPLYHVLGLAFDSPRFMGTVGRPDAGEPSGHCARCHKPPIVGVLREDKAAETVRRSLVCSFCAWEWDFPRVLCPNCREEAPEKLVRLTAQEIPWMRVEACDSCKTYLKSVDLTKCPEAEPVVDELASLPLDLIAREQGYVKIAPNLAGL